MSGGGVGGGGVYFEHWQRASWTLGSAGVQAHSEIDVQI